MKDKEFVPTHVYWNYIDEFKLGRLSEKKPADNPFDSYLLFYEENGKTSTIHCKDVTPLMTPEMKERVTKLEALAARVANIHKLNPQSRCDDCCLRKERHTQCPFCEAARLVNHKDPFTKGDKVQIVNCKYRKREQGVIHVVGYTGTTSVVEIPVADKNLLVFSSIAAGEVVSRNDKGQYCIRHEFRHENLERVEG